MALGENMLSTFARKARGSSPDLSLAGRSEDLANASLTLSLELYRGLALEMLRRAHCHATPNMRCAHLMLAMDWKELADSTEWLLLKNGVTAPSGDGAKARCGTAAGTALVEQERTLRGAPLLAASNTQRAKEISGACALSAAPERAPVRRP